MKIGIIGALEKEIIMIRDQLSNKVEKIVARCEFYSGKINELEIILLKSGIGKVNAAIGTTLMIQLYQPDYIINTGSAGGFYPTLEIGDIVISTALQYHDVDVTVSGYDYGQIPQMPLHFSPDRKLVQIAEHCATKITEFQTVKGLIASGDSFMDDPMRVEFIRTKVKDIYAAEMESAGIAQVCHQFKVPFVIIRSISDLAGKDAKRTFDQSLETAAKNSATLVLHMIEELRKENEKTERRKF